MGLVKKTELWGEHGFWDRLSPQPLTEQAGSKWRESSEGDTYSRS